MFARLSEEQQFRRGGRSNKDNKPSFVQVRGTCQLKIFLKITGRGGIQLKGWLASAKLRSLVEIILARPIRGQDFNFSFNVIFLSTTDVNYVGQEVNSRPALQDVDQHV